MITHEVAAALILLPFSIVLLGLYIFSVIGAFIEALWDKD